MKIWSPLHGDMQVAASKEVLLRASNSTMNYDRKARAKFLVG
jgi:hypothetical protein